MKLFEAELKVMEVLWCQGSLEAIEIVKLLKESTGWNKNTTYTVIKRCIEKGAIERSEPRFKCTALLTKEEVQRRETKELINKMYGGSPELFFSAFIDSGLISDDKLLKLQKEIEQKRELERD